MTFNMKNNAVAIVWQDKDGKVSAMSTLMNEAFPQTLYYVLSSLFRTLKKHGMPYKCSLKSHAEGGYETGHSVVDSISFERMP